MFCSKMIKTTSTRKATGDKYPNSTSTLSTNSSTFFASTSITDSYRSSQPLDDDSRRISNDTTKSVRWDTRTAADAKANDNDAEFSELFYSAYSSNRKKNSHRARTSKSSGTIHSNSKSSNNNTTSDSSATTKPLAGAARRIRSYIANQKFGTTRKSNSSNNDDDDKKKKRDIDLDETKRDSSRMESSTGQ